MNIDKVMKDIEYEAYRQNIIKDKFNLNYSERCFLISVRRILEKENEK